MDRDELAAEFDRTADEVRTLGENLAQSNALFRASLTELTVFREQIEAVLPNVQAVAERAADAVTRGRSLLNDTAKALTASVEILAGYESYVVALKEKELTLRGEAMALRRREESGPS
jgi:hypothetical protein